MPVETATGTVTNPTDPTPSAIATPPAADPAPVVATPAPAAATLLGDDPKPAADPKPPAAADPKPPEPPKLKVPPRSTNSRPRRQGIRPAGFGIVLDGSQGRESVARGSAKVDRFKMAPALGSAQQEQTEAIHKGWLEASKSDRNSAAKSSRELGSRQERLDQFATPDCASFWISPALETTRK
jgi:hypothetical protein